MKQFFILLTVLTTLHFASFSQCGVTINSFPYNESFEVNTGNWVSGGVANDWAWGTPNKAFIQNAGNGVKCWVTGGLNGSVYNINERSYLLSPCFDFTNLQFPHIKFKIYWETENQYDGATLQYTTNNGATWNNVGAVNDPVDCLNSNWFNNGSINALNTLASPQHGWSGTALPTNGNCSGGNGSLGWVTAQHCLSNLAGLQSVQFRFAFGAGSICNGYDGVAVDDITISEADPNVADFNFSCTGNGLEYQMTNTSQLCPNAFSWNFGDPAAGASNISANQNPTHIFTAPGTYNVTLSVSGPCNQSSSIVKTITTLNMNVNVISLSCFNSNTGSLTATATGVTGIPTYTLQPGGLNNNTGLFNNLAAGVYTVSVLDGAGCVKTATATVGVYPVISWIAVAPNNISCNGGNTGGINALATGGNGIFTYHLEPVNLTNNNGTFNSLVVGVYTVTATDANGCSISSTVALSQPLPIVFMSANITNPACFNDGSGAIQVNYNGGIGGLTYALLPTGATNGNGQFGGLNGGSYTIVATDATGCTQSTTAFLSQPPAIVITQTDIIQPGCNPNNDGVIVVHAHGGIGSFTFSNGGVFGIDSIFTNLTAGSYTVTVKDATGCTKSTTAALLSVNAPDFTTANATAIKCYGGKDGSIQVAANGNAAILFYGINPGNFTDPNGTFNNLGAGIYTVTVSDVNSCTNTTAIQVNSPAPLLFEKLQYTAGKCGSNLDALIYANVTGGSGNKSYVLNPGGVNSFDGLFSSIQSSGIYTVTVTDGNQCSASSQLILEERICCDNLIIPNAFSPNNDGKNDEFRILNLKGIDLKEFIIYNRWGGIAFKSQNVNDSWDGKTFGVECETGSYYYFIRYTCVSTGKEHITKGDVTLVR